MARVYADCIEEGTWTIERVYYKWKAQTYYFLITDGYKPDGINPITIADVPAEWQVSVQALLDANTTV